MPNEEGKWTTYELLDTGAKVITAGGTFYLCTKTKSKGARKRGRRRVGKR